jgi:hypothetical protein
LSGRHFHWFQPRSFSTINGDPLVANDGDANCDLARELLSWPFRIEEQIVERMEPSIKELIETR